MIHGNTGKDFTLMASCDEKYLLDHAKGFVTSAALAKNNVHLHVTNPKARVHQYLEFLGKGYAILYPEGIYTTSFDQLDINHLSGEYRKTWYACNRFLVAADVMQTDILLLDIDCLIMKHIDNIDSDIGLFLRDEEYKEWDGEAGKVAAGAVYINQNHKDFLFVVKDFIENNKKHWFVDQVALKRAYEAFPNKRYHVFDNKFMDWDFKPNTTIWTGKGPRKALNAVYTGKHKEFRHKFPIKDADYFK
jgi:hypothetical protein